MTFLALAISAGVAFAAALFVNNSRLTALRTQVAYFQQGLVFGCGFSGLRGGSPLLGRLHWRGASLFADHGTHVQPGGALGDVLVQHLRHTIGQGAHPLGTESQRTPATDTRQLADDLLHTLGGFHRRGDAQHVADHPSDGFGDRGGIRAGFGGVDEHFKGLGARIFIYRDKRFSERCLDGEGVAHQKARAGFLRNLPEPGLILLGLVQVHPGVVLIPWGGFRAGRRGGFFCSSGFGLQHHPFARTGHVDGHAFAAQFPRQQVRAGNFLLGGIRGEIDRLGHGIVYECLHGSLHAHVFLGADVLRDDEYIPDGFGQFLHLLAGAVFHHPGDDLLLVFFGKFGSLERFFEVGAGVIEGKVLAVIVHMAGVCQGKDRFAAVAFAASYRGDRTGGRDGGLGGVADAIALDADGSLHPIHRRATPVVCVFDDGLGGFPGDIGGVVDAALDGGESAAFPGKLDAGEHGMVAHEFHHLRGEFLPGGGTVAHAHVVHQVRQPHDSQPDPAGALGGFTQLRYGGDVLVGVHHVVQEAGGEGDRTLQGSPIHILIGGEELRQVDGSQAAVLVGSEILFAARVGGFELVQVGDWVSAVGGVEEEHAGFSVVVRLFDDLVEQVAGAHALVGLERDASQRGLLEGAVEAAVTRVGDVGELQVPAAVVLHRRHKGIRDAHGNVEIGDLVLIRLAGDELFDIRMVHAQHSHVGSAPRAALGDFAEGMVVDAQEAHRSGSLPGGGFHQGALGAQVGEVETVAPAGLLDEGGIPQGLEDACGFFAHVVG